MEKPDLVFLTPDNEAELKTEIAPAVLEQIEKRRKEVAEQELERINANAAQHVKQSTD